MTTAAARVIWSSFQVDLAPSLMADSLHAASRSGTRRDSRRAGSAPRSCVTPAASLVSVPLQPGVSALLGVFQELRSGCSDKPWR